MARKRDYKAEYARRKAKAISLGYRSPRQEYKARKSLGMTRGFPSLRYNELPDFSIAALTGDDRRLRRREAAAWSARHSHVKGSQYKGNMSNEQFNDYYNAFVADYSTFGPSRRKRAKEKRKRIYRYLKKYGFPVEGTEEAWKSPKPESQS